jgi:hypothetical protein
MRSCEYLKVKGTEQRTKLLRVRNLRFFKGRRLLPYNSLMLHMADCVTINFEFQKQDNRDEDVTQHRSDDPILCPVCVWANVVRHILAINGATEECTLNTYANSSGKLCQLSSKTVNEPWSNAWGRTIWAMVPKTSAPSPYGLGQQWQCTSREYQYIQSCYWAAGPATPSSATSVARCRSSEKAFPDG